MLDFISEDQIEQLSDIVEEAETIMSDITEYFNKEILGMTVTEITLTTLVEKYSDIINVLNDSDTEMVLEFTIPGTNEEDEPTKINKIINKDVIFPFVEDSVLKVTDKFLILFKSAEYDGKRSAFSLTYSFDKNKKLMKFCLIDTVVNGEETERFMIPVLVRNIKGDKKLSGKDFEDIITNTNDPSQKLTDEQMIIISSTSPKFDKIISKNPKMSIGEFAKEILKISSTDLNYHNKINTLLMKLYRSTEF